MSHAEQIEKLPDYDPRALYGFALVAEREGDADTARVFRAAAQRIERLTDLAEGASFHFFCCGAGVRHDDDCGQLIPAMADLAKAIGFYNDPATAEEIAAAPASSASAKLALLTQEESDV
ncbi:MULTISPECIES: hypothetical protein [Bacteria]|uniref:hypothetical protein n=1 Tax=Bacteria TaxID=2 RepID=UPI0037019F36